MAKNYVQPGNVLDFVNNTAAKVLSGAVVMIGVLAGVLASSAEVGETVAVAVSGVFALPLKPATPLAVGAIAYFNPDTGLIEGTPAGDNVPAGSVVTEAASGDATVEVLLNNNSGGTH